jgi:two-component system sensor histidine kinase/response regulator
MIPPYHIYRMKAQVITVPRCILRESIYYILLIPHSLLPKIKRDKEFHERIVMQSDVDAQPVKNIVGNRTTSIGHIIVVDDNPNNLKLLEGMLHNSGFAVRLFPRGELALTAASVNPPDLILLDIMMPVMDGYAVCAKLKADPLLADIPVIFLSALNDTSDKVKAFQAGGVDYISKPFQIEEVRARIETHLEIKRQRRLLQENFEKLQQLEKLRDNLVHMIVHDMRSPLTIINGMHEILEKFDGTNLSPDGLKRLQSANKRTEELIALVNSLLDISKLESGNMKLNIVNFDVVTLIKSITSNMADAFIEHTISLVLPESTELIFGDQSLISRVVQNLLNNAIKYSPKGTEIRVSIQLSDNEVRIVIEDHGAGIIPEYQAKIFDKFFQIGHNKNSSGLGLTFCKLAVEAHGGKIGVESEVGQGSKFWFDLPKEIQR